MHENDKISAESFADFDPRGIRQISKRTKGSL